VASDADYDDGDDDGFALNDLNLEMDTETTAVMDGKEERKPRQNEMDESDIHQLPPHRPANYRTNG